MKWLILKIKLDYSNFTYSLNLAMFNLLTCLNKPNYLIRFNNYLPTYLGNTCQHLISRKLDDLNFIN
jgi:hypothetical protein